MVFSIKESVVFGWHKTRENSKLLFQVILTLFALQVCYAIVTRVLEGSVVGVLATIALAVAQYVTGVGFTLITLRIAQKKHVEFKEIIPPSLLLWQYLFASILVGLIAIGAVLGVMLGASALGAAFGGAGSDLFRFFFGAGILLSITTLVYISLRFSVVRFAVLDGADVLESLAQSTKMTKSHLWRLFLFFCVLGLINILGALCFLVGLLVTIPVTMIAYAHVYQKLHTHAHTH